MISKTVESTSIKNKQKLRNMRKRMGAHWYSPALPVRNRSITDIGYMYC